MKATFTFLRSKALAYAATLCILFSVQNARSQVSSVCTDPTNYIYGLTASGAIYPINVNNATTGSATKNTTYSGNSPSRSNGLGYNASNGKFYYFKRSVGQSPDEFVSFDPLTNTVTILADCPLSAEIHTGCVSSTGTGYYTIDIDGNMGYYNIVSNSWTIITSSFKDQFNNDVTSIIKTQNAGDIAIDGLGNLWIITSSSSNFGVYKLNAPLPTTAIAQATVTQVLAPTTATPSGNMIAGIAFNPTGQIYLSTKIDNRLYRLENSLTTTYVATFSTNDVGNDLTSCNFPMAILPVVWLNFEATVKDKNKVTLSWTVSQQNNKGFYIQHSTNNNTWTEVAFIASKTGGKDIQEYSFTHINNGSNKQYYRIRQQDLDGKESYSATRSVMLQNEGGFVSVWPNPVKENLNFTFDNNTGKPFTKAQVFDLTGRLAAEKALQPGANTINLASLNKGIYILKLLGDGMDSYSQKILKQ